MRFLMLLAILASAANGADFTTYIGPAILNESVILAALTIDPSGNTYVTGDQVTALQGSVGAFVTKLDTAGNIVFTSSIGLAGTYANTIALDPSGNIWIGGQTVSNNFPLLNALQTSGSYGTGFVMKLAPNGIVLYSSYFGGVLGNSAVTGIATDSSGNVYVTGFTDASDFPTTPGLPAFPVTGSTLGTVFGAFAAKLNATGQSVVYSAVIGGTACGPCFANTPVTVGIGIAVDGAGNALIAGDSDITDLPVTAGGTSGLGAFAFKINAAGNQLVYLTYLGSDVGVGNFDNLDSGPASPIISDASGNAYIAGCTNSPDFPFSSGANQQTYAIALSPEGVPVWDITLVKPTGSWANGISLDSSGNVWVTGTNGSMAAPGQPFVEQLVASTSIVGPVAARDVMPPFSGAQFPAGVAGQAIAIDQSGVVHFAGYPGFVSTLTPTQPLTARTLSIVNAASGQLTGLLAPGEVISIYGLGMGPVSGVSATPANGLFPNSLAGVQVMINGAPIPLLYVSATQINAEIPSGIANGVADVQVSYNGRALPDFRLAVVGSQFAVFTNSSGSMAVLNQDGTVNQLANPATPGTVVSFWATGFGVTGAPADGAVAIANNYCASCQITLHYESTNTTETVQYAGTSPGLIDGLTQFNVPIPADWNNNGAWVVFTPPGYSQPIQLGWVDIAQ
jgi:uncharacterized protein (TIGR03437 family)